MSGGTTISGRAQWLNDPGLQRLLAVLSEGGEEARIAGGAVRNTLLGEAVTDVDIATTNHPEETMRRAERAGMKAVPTGAEHGTITVVAGRRPFEVTTLRADIETDGRRAKVAFGRDWKRDAERRDFTINALYAEADGTVVDLVGGLADLESRRLRFIGDAETRIREDFLRILRFFRFFAWYGSGRPDAEGLKASARLKEGLDRLSAERVWMELKKLLSAPDPSRALLWMRQTSVLTRVLPETEKWGIDSIHPLTRAEGDLGWAADPLLRLMAIIPPDEERVAAMSARLKMSTAETERLRRWARTPSVPANASEGDLAKLMYRAGRQAVLDRLRLSVASARSSAGKGNGSDAGDRGNRLVAFAETWEQPRFPVSGKDLAALGVAQGPGMGALLSKLEDLWIQSGFELDRDALLERAARDLNA